MSNSQINSSANRKIIASLMYMVGPFHCRLRVCVNGFVQSCRDCRRQCSLVLIRLSGPSPGAPAAHPRGWLPQIYTQKCDRKSVSYWTLPGGEIFFCNSWLNSDFWFFHWRFCQHWRSCSRLSTTTSRKCILLLLRKHTPYTHLTHTLHRVPRYPPLWRGHLFTNYGFDVLSPE